MKYFTMSFDDGVEEDKTLLEIQKSFGLNCTTFNLNSGLYGVREPADPTQKRTEPTADGFVRIPHNHFRIPADEIAQVYAGVEVAAHGVYHRNLKDLNRQQTEEEILQDKAALEQLLNKKVEGFIFAFGVGTDDAYDVIRRGGFTYTRGVRSTRSWAVPGDFLRLEPTCFHMGQDTMDLLDRFLKEETEEDRLFYMWGHGYEMTYNTPTGSFEYMKRLLDKVAGRQDIICCSNGEAVRALTAKTK